MPDAAPTRSTPLAAVLALTFICSLSTGVTWSGIPFIVKHEYHFGQARNLLLSAVMGCLYVLCALAAGPILRRIGHKVRPRTVLGVVIGLMSALALLPVAVVHEWAIWLAASTISCLSATIWPIVESYLTAGRHGAAMRSAMGWFNVVWTLAVASAMLLMAGVLEEHARWGIGGTSIVNLCALVSLAWFQPSPGRHDEHESSAATSPEYPRLLQSVRWLLPVSYLLVAAMMPILPYRFEQLGVAVSWETPATATWMLMRTVALFVMWRVGFWHGRWGTLLLGAVAVTGGFAVIVLAATLGVMLTGFTIFGIGMAVLYYASLYYSMAVGRAEVAAGGVFEALIGLGYTVGPLAGLAGLAIADRSGGALREGPAIVAIVWALVGLAAVPAVLPYFIARKRRRST